MSLLKLSLAALPALVLAGRPYPDDDCTLTTTYAETTIPTVLPTIKVEPKGKGREWENIHEVVYDTFCSTGLEPHTYTVTKTCDSAYCGGKPTYGPEPGFTTTKSVCSSCGPKPITATLTVPTSKPSCHGKDCEDDKGPSLCESLDCDEWDDDNSSKCKGHDCDDKDKDKDDDSSKCKGHDCDDKDKDDDDDYQNDGHKETDGESPVVGGGSKLQTGFMAIAMSVLMALPIAI